MFTAVPDKALIPFDSSTVISELSCAPPESAPSTKECKNLLADLVGELDHLQRKLYAHNRFSVLLVFQALDAAGKDSTIRSVLSGVNPAGCQVFSFKQPSHLELDHDFLWRTNIRLPERGRIGVFNRSYYEEVLVVRVHPKILENQQLPFPPDESIWETRLKSIREHEKHLARNGTIILKFWLNVSKEEQCKRFLARIDNPEKNWKFSEADLREREFWDRYMSAYQEALRETSTPWAPWYAIPADSKRYMRYRVADIIVRSMKTLDLQYPEVSNEQRQELVEMRKVLVE